MKKCPHCAEDVQDEAKVCKHCGRDLVPPARKGVGWVYVLLALLALGVVAAVLPDQAPTEDEQRSNAATICQQFVTKRLRSPTTADFQPTSEATVQPISGGEFEVTSYVDSQNGFGALVRSAYVCTVKPVDDKNWTLVDLKLDSQ